MEGQGRFSEQLSVGSGTLATDGCEEQIQLLLDMCRMDDGKTSIKLFLEEMAKMGILHTDPRIKNMLDVLLKLSPTSTLDDLVLDPQTFRTVVNENIILVNKAFQNRMIIPAFEAFCDSITDIYSKCKLNEDGVIFDRLPQFASADPKKFGIAICTIDGQRFSIGDVDHPFVLESICKPITYGITLNELSEEVVHKYQGREPSGRKQDDIALDYNNKPFNPLINSGALVSASLLVQLVHPELDDLARKYEYVFNIFQKLSGGEVVQFNNSVFLAEKSSTDRDFALAYFLRENSCFPAGTDLKKILDFYFQLSSLEMTCNSNAVVAASLANQGTCPITGERVMSMEAVNHVLELMYSCGMSLSSGEFAFKIGLPAMSSPTGTIMLVVPDVMGICIYSPLIDRVRNSVRGVQFCQELVNRYRFHRFDVSNEKYDPTLKKIYSVKETNNQLLFAAANGDLKALKRAFLKDVDLNMSDYDGRTALHLCAAEGHVDCVRFLLEVAKVNPDPLDRWNNTPHSEASGFGHQKLVVYLRDFMLSHPEQLQTDYSAYADDFPPEPDVQDRLCEEGNGFKLPSAAEEWVGNVYKNLMPSLDRAGAQDGSRPETPA